MKKIIMLMLGILFTASLLAQERQLSNVADINIPKGAEKLDSDRIISHSKKIFKRSQTGIWNRKKNLYKIGDVSIAFWDVSTGYQKRPLEAIKSEALELFKLNKNIAVENARIENFKNKRFLIINYQNGDAYYSYFVSDYVNDKTLTGIIEFQSSDQEKAKVILHDMLNNLKFK